MLLLVFPNFLRLSEVCLQCLIRYYKKRPVSSINLVPLFMTSKTATTTYPFWQPNAVKRHWEPTLTQFRCVTLYKQHVVQLTNFWRQQSHWLSLSSCTINNIFTGESTETHVCYKCHSMTNIIPYIYLFGYYNMCPTALVNLTDTSAYWPNVAYFLPRDAYA